jgi:hypothetical protein
MKNKLTCWESFSTLSLFLHFFWSKSSGCSWSLRVELGLENCFLTLVFWTKVGGCRIAVCYGTFYALPLSSGISKVAAAKELWSMETAPFTLFLWTRLLQ